MKRNAITTVVTYCILALAGVVSFVLPDELVVTNASAAGPTVIRLPRTLRDAGNLSPAIDNKDANDSVFAPEDRLFGVERQALPYAVEARFTRSKCMDQYFEFQGADDAWLFVEGVLVMDRGGVIPRVGQVDIDRLDLAPGKTDTIHFFYAQPSLAISSLHIRTKIALTGEDVAYTMGGVD